MTQQFIFTRPLEVKTSGNDVLLEGFISTTDRDLVNDVITPNCLKSMREQVLDKNIKLDLEHESFRGDSTEEKEINKTKVPIGRLTDATISNNKLKVKAKINQFHQRFEETKGSLTEGYLDAFSIAYIPTKISTEIKDGQEIRLLDDLTLLNVALTGNPVNTEAQIRDVMIKSMDELKVADSTLPSSTEQQENDEETDKKKKKKNRADTLRQARNEALEGDDEASTKNPKNPDDYKIGKKDAIDEYKGEGLEVKDKSYSHSETNNNKEVKQMTEEKEKIVESKEGEEAAEEPAPVESPAPAEPSEEPASAPAQESLSEVKALREELEALRKEFREVNTKAIREKTPEIKGKSFSPLDIIS